MSNQNRHVLGVGYPWGMLGDNNTYETVGLSSTIFGYNPIPLDFSEKLWSQDVRKYNLVLEIDTGNVDNSNQKEIERLNNENEKLRQENASLTAVVTCAKEFVMGYEMFGAISRKYYSNLVGSLLAHNRNAMNLFTGKEG